MGEKIMTTKTCTKCGEEKTEDQYYSRNGRSESVCKNCRKQAEKDRYANKKLTILSRNKNWRVLNAEKLKESKRNYYQRNRQNIIDAALEWASSNPEKIKIKNKNWKRKNPHKLRQYRIAAKMRSHGSSLRTYQTLMEQQEGKCAICGSEEKLVVDHDHVSGHIRGLLCNNCNAALGFLKESIDIFSKAIVYLKKHSR